MKTKNKVPAGDKKISRNVRGKKTRDPGYKPGDHWVQCDRCAAVIRSSDAMITWDNLVVCPDDWEIRHPQDFVRGRADDIAAKGLRRSEGEDVFVSGDCPTRSGIAGIAVAGCAICGTPPYFTEIPPGTFINDTGEC